MKVGDELIFRFHDSRRGEHWTEIIKVGRKWAYTKCGYKIDLKTKVADGEGYNSPGYVGTKEELAIRDRRVAAWGKIKDAIRHQYSVPEFLSDEQITLVSLILTGEQP